jgi:hypothetical protein
LHPELSARQLLLLLALLLLPACGVSFVSSFDGTELFKKLELQGDLYANRELILAVDVNQAYPVPVRVACYYEDREHLSKDEKKVAFQERATLIGERVLDASDAESPGDDVQRQTLRFTFAIPEAGKYFAACLTPASPENGIGVSFELRPAIDAVAEVR